MPENPVGEIGVYAGKAIAGAVYVHGFFAPGKVNELFPYGSLHRISPLILPILR